ncbi:MAG: glycosyltransferase family 2 protein [Ktedonobacteraceae bacterium]|nr:glycosyltransferase family 2 protein [Ktedonobacteraceae bacterium]
MALSGSVFSSKQSKLPLFVQAGGVMKARLEKVSISLVIPAKNEAENLRHVLPAIPPLVDEVILVDGHSTDDTINVARQILPSVRIVEQQGHGKGDALSAGFAASTGDIIVMLDADGSTDPAEIPRFVESLLAGNDFVKGSRFLKGGKSYDITLLRRLGNAVLLATVNLLFPAHCTDLCYGYTAFWRRCLDQVDISCNGFEVETLMYLRMRKAGLKITEVPSVEHKRIHGASNLNTFRDGWRVLRTIFAERFSYIPPLPQPQSLPQSQSLPSLLPSHNAHERPAEPRKLVL